MSTIRPSHRGACFNSLGLRFSLPQDAGSIVHSTLKVFVVSGLKYRVWNFIKDRLKSTVTHNSKISIQQTWPWATRVPRASRATATAPSWTWSRFWLPNGWDTTQINLPAPILTSLLRRWLMSFRPYNYLKLPSTTISCNLMKGIQAYDYIMTEKQCLHGCPTVLPTCWFSLLTW